MFETAVLESAHPFEARCGWSALTAAALQISALVLLVLLPLLRPALIVARFNEAPVPLMSVPIIRESAPTQPTAGSQIEVQPTGRLVQPSQIPPRINTGPTEAPAPNLLGRLPCTANCSPIRSAIDAIGTSAPPAPPKPARIVFSHLDEGSVLVRVTPVYPPLAKAARVQGDVTLSAIIAKDGTVQNLQLVSGHPMLAAAALRAVGQWKFRPYILDGSPVEVATQITVHFRLSNE